MILLDVLNNKENHMDASLTTIFIMNLKNETKLIVILILLY